MNKLKLQTHNIVDENIKKIAELFPNCITERLDENGKPEVAIDFDQLRQELSKEPMRRPPTRCALAARRASISTTRRTSTLRATTSKC